MSPGDVLAGKYRVERVLGVGGMGVVVAAKHLQLDQMVALKFLLPEAIANKEAADRFLREARNAVQLKSEHVARIIDVGTLETGAPYIVMEYLEGADLAQVLAQQGRLAIPAAVDFILQACDAIAEAHARGIIHRDLKPPNLFVTRGHDGTNLVKVLDFGISKSTASTDFVATRTQSVMGSPAYMSPEQMRSSKLVDVRTDVWALGIILHQCVIGWVPWAAETFTELCFKVAQDPLPPLPNASGLPRGFEAVVRKCLEKDPNLRFPDVYALAIALMPYAPAQSQMLVERIGRVLRGETGPRGGGLGPSAPTIYAGPGGTGGELAGQKVTAVGAGKSKKGMIAGIAAVVVLAVGISVMVAVSSGGGGGSGSAQPEAQPKPEPQPQPQPQPKPQAQPSPQPTPTPTPTPSPPPPPPPSPSPSPSTTTTTPTPPPAKTEPKKTEPKKTEPKKPPVKPKTLDPLSSPE